MNSIELAREIIATYERHGWELKRILLSSATRAQFNNEPGLTEALRVDSDFDALWFARSSRPQREAWELRRLSPQPYALFEAFEADESEEDREEARREMENRMRDVARKTV